MLKHFELTTELKQVITAPTRIAKQTKSTIDLAFTNIKYCTGSGVLNYNISDHKPIYILKKKPRNIKRTIIHRGWTYRNFTQQKLEETLESQDHGSILNETDPNKYWIILFECITKAADALCPIIDITIRENIAKYLNNELLELELDRDHFDNKAGVIHKRTGRYIYSRLLS